MGFMELHAGKQSFPWLNIMYSTRVLFASEQQVSKLVSTQCKTSKVEASIEVQNGHPIYSNGPRLASTIEHLCYSSLIRVRLCDAAMDVSSLYIYTWPTGHFICIVVCRVELGRFSFNANIALLSSVEIVHI